MRSAVLIYCAATLRAFGNGIIAVLRLVLWPRPRPLRAAKICVYRVGAIGDLICAMPALYAIRRAYPDAQLTLLTTAGKYGRARHAEELFAGADWIDEIITYDLAEVAARQGRIELAARLRAHRFDLWFDLTLDRARFLRILRDMMLARMLGARWAFGWRLEHLGFAARAEAETREFPDEVERLAAILRRGGIARDATLFPTFDDARIRDDDFRFEDNRLIAIAPGARRPCNLWPTGRFVAVADALAARGVRIALIGGAGDRPLCEEIRVGAVGEVVNLAGTLSLRQSRALLRRCELLVCVDSGPQHLAASVGTPCVAIFSQRNPRRRWYPHGTQHRVLEASVACHTCLLDQCPHDNLCMKQIGVTAVIDSALDILDTPPALTARSPAIAQAQGQ